MSGGGKMLHVVCFFSSNSRRVQWRELMEAARRVFRVRHWRGDDVRDGVRGSAAIAASVEPIKNGPGNPGLT